MKRRVQMVHEATCLRRFNIVIANDVVLGFDVFTFINPPPSVGKCSFFPVGVAKFLGAAESIGVALGFLCATFAHFPVGDPVLGAESSVGAFRKGRSDGVVSKALRGDKLD